MLTATAACDVSASRPALEVRAGQMVDPEHAALDQDAADVSNGGADAVADGRRRQRKLLEARLHAARDHGEAVDVDRAAQQACKRPARNVASTAGRVHDVQPDCAAFGRSVSFSK